MDIRKIDDNISVAPQISVDDVAEAAKLGFKTIVANRPDHEEPGQPAMADIEAAAREQGLEWVYMPVESGNITDEDVNLLPLRNPLHRSLGTECGPKHVSQ